MGRGGRVGRTDIPGLLLGVTTLAGLAAAGVAAVRLTTYHAKD